jgi:putative FmdB family regulatory protein
MPIYEYVCKKCKNKFELMRPFSRSQEAADCPKCSSKADRILSTCYAMTSSESGVTKTIDGSGSSCSSCSSGNCSSCGH